MLLMDNDVVWSPSDLTQAAACEFAVLRRLDTKLNRGPATTAEDSPLMRQIADLGEAHEARILHDLRAQGTVTELRRATSSALPALQEMAAATLAALQDPGTRLVFQAGFFADDFQGYADFLERTDDGWIVSDAKLARRARPKALLQLAAYADQLIGTGLPVAPRAALLLGSGRREEFSLAEILPVFRERRARLRGIIADHREATGPVAWGDDRYVACGSCADCAAAAEEFEDVILTAGLRMAQRRKLRAEGVLTLTQLAHRTLPVAGMSSQTLAKLQRQATLQLAQRQSGNDEVSFELIDGAVATLDRLPEPSPGDVFFDFEGDPLYNEGDLTTWGLEYLWGAMTASGDGADAEFRPWWAHDRVQERAALIGFLDWVIERRAAHPDMHVYHYAPYETTALKRLVSTYQTHEAELDTLLRAGVFVDLYATVRGSIRISQPSYSIKKLEPLYMGSELRESDVTSGDQSIVEYHAYRQLVEDEDGAAAGKRLEQLEDYNRYDCLSTLRLYEWLLDRKAGSPTSTVPHVLPVEVESATVDEADELHDTLTELAGDVERPARTPEQQSYAMLAAALGYFRREDRPFWWEHFDRLARPLDEWTGDRNVFHVVTADVIDDWAVAGRQKNPRRRVRLEGEWGAGSTPGTKAGVVYSEPLPPGLDQSANSTFGYRLGRDIEIDVAGAAVDLVETGSPDDSHQQMPVALVPDSPPNAGIVRDAVRAVAAAAANAPLPGHAVLDLLRRRPPSLRTMHALPNSGDNCADIVDALVGMDSSYVAVQGPPGSGKTYTGSRAIKELVEKHHWRVGVVAQSHAVVEHMLDAIVGAKLDPTLVGKSKPKHGTPAWAVVADNGDARAAFLNDHADTGCVLGGTAWTFCSDKLIGVGGLDLLVIDEAGQFALGPTIGVSRVADRLLLLGDPQQLPQVSQGTHPEPVDQSALAWLLGDHDTIPTTHGYFLDSSYRMHPALCAKVSALAYEGRLDAAPAAAQRSLEGVEPGLAVIRLDHHDNQTESNEEADEVVRVVQDLLGTSWHSGADLAARPLGQADFLVVAPYNAQVNLIRSRLHDAGLDGVQVGTVDKFQGREAPVAIVSMTASSHGDVPRGMGFLLSRNRVNVAVSRAQWLAVVIRSTALTTYMPSSVPELLELGSFIGLCGVQPDG